MTTLESLEVTKSVENEPIHLDPAWVAKRIAKRWCCTVATTSSQLRPHATTVLYVAVGANLYVNTLRSSRKARNIAGNPNVSICIPIRRVPIGPPSSVQFAALATLLDVHDSEIVSLINAGALKRITSHGETELEGACFIRITPTWRINAYGLGMPLRRLIADPLHAAGVTEAQPFTAPPLLPAQ